MPPKIIVDENIELKIIESLRENKLSTISVFEKHRGVSDLEVINIAEENKALILTEDKDFGKWVFSHHKPTTGVILLRFHNQDLDEIIKSLLHLLNKHDADLYGKFAVITKNKIRIREI